MDAHRAQIVDIVWDEGAAEPRIDANVVRVKDWAPDEKLAAAAAKAYEVLDKMRHTQLAVVPDELRPLTSRDARGKLVTMGKFLLSAIRDARGGVVPRRASRGGSQPLFRSIPGSTPVEEATHTKRRRSTRTTTSATCA